MARQEVGTVAGHIGKLGYDEVFTADPCAEAIRRATGGKGATWCSTRRAATLLAAALTP
jgi:hypothetical protein